MRVSIRTLYRNIASLAQGAHIDGGHGLRAQTGIHAAAADVLRGGNRGAGARFPVGGGSR
jgi:hypothetical protein